MWGSSVADAFEVSRLRACIGAIREGNRAYRGRNSVVANRRVALRAAVAARLAGRVAGEGHAVAIIDGAPVMDPVIRAADVTGVALAWVAAVPIRAVSSRWVKGALVLAQALKTIVRVRPEPGQIDRRALCSNFLEKLPAGNGTEALTSVHSQLPAESLRRPIMMGLLYPTEAALSLS